MSNLVERTAHDDSADLFIFDDIGGDGITAAQVKTELRELGDVDPEPAGQLREMPPEHLTPEQRMAWQWIVYTAPKGILYQSDEIMLMMASCLLAEYKCDPDGMTTSRIARLETQLGKFGLSPSDRARLGVSPDDDNDEF